MGSGACARHAHDARGCYVKAFDKKIPFSEINNLSRAMLVDEVQEAPTPLVEVAKEV